MLGIPAKSVVFFANDRWGMAIKFKLQKVTRDIPRRDSRDNVEEVLGRKEYRGKEVKVLNLTEQHGLPKKCNLVGHKILCMGEIEQKGTVFKIAKYATLY